MDQRTELGVYISSEFCCEASSFIFLEGGTPSRSLGLGGGGKRKKRETQVDTPGQQLGSARRLQVSPGRTRGWASEVLTPMALAWTQKGSWTHSEPHIRAIFTYIHHVTCVFQLLTNYRVITYGVLSLLSKIEG